VNLLSYEVVTQNLGRSAGMVVIGSHGWGAMMSLIFGSTTLGVLQHAPCPVVVVRDRTDDAGEETA